MSFASKALKRSSFEVFRMMDRLGVHVLPKHYYTPVQDQAWLDANRNLWARPADMTGVDWNLDEQLSWLRDACANYSSEVRGLKIFHEGTAAGYGLGYGPIESQVLHCVIRHHKPARIIEVGSGVSTFCTDRALQLNESRGGGQPLT